MQFAVLLPVVLTLVSTQTANSEFLRNVSKLCYPKWALEAFVIANANRYNHLITYISVIGSKMNELFIYFEVFHL